MDKGSKRNTAVVMLGARRHYAVPEILHRAGRLERLYTDSYRKRALERGLVAAVGQLFPKSKLLMMFAGRRSGELDGGKVTRFERLGIDYALARRKVSSRQEKERLNDATAATFGARVVAAGAAEHGVVYAFKGAARETFEVAGKTTIKILDQSILPGELTMRLLQKEQNEWGCWYKVRTELEFLDLTLSRERREWDLADLILAGSQFVRKGLVECGVPEAKILVVPYGVSLPAREAIKERNGPLKLLFAGKVGLRKGAHYLLKALEAFQPEEVQAVFAGDCELTDEIRTRYSDRVVFAGRVPRAEMDALYDQSDVFILPSIVEGSALVTYEALARALPVITTPNAGSLVIDGVNGQVVPVGDASAIAEAIRTYMNNEAIWSSHASEALKMRHEVSREAYGERLITVLEDFELNGQG